MGCPPLPVALDGVAQRGQKVNGTSGSLTKELTL